MSNIVLIISVVIGAFVLGCANGYFVRDGAAKSAAAKAFKAAEGQRIVLQGQLDVVSAKYEKERERSTRLAMARTNTVREFYRTAPPVDPSCAVPDPMYGLLVNSVRDANVAASSEPSDGLPKPAPSAVASGRSRTPNLGD
jgi:hypothetical protein